MYEPRDEISLRELYLIFRSGFLAILLVTLAAGAGAFLFISSQPERYEATATVQINVPSGNPDSEEAAWLLPPVGLGLNGYTAVSERADVLASAAGTDEDDEATLRQLKGRLTLGAIDTSNQARGQLTVGHTASAPTAEEAARLANAWAQATASAATRVMEQTVVTNAEASSRELAQREADLQEARRQWTEFAERDERNALTTRINVQPQLQREAMLRLATLNNLIATSQAQRDLLQATLEARTGGGTTSLHEQLEAMVRSGALRDDTAQMLESALAQLPAGLTTGGQDLLTLVTRTRVEALTADLAGYIAERELLQRTLGESDTELTSLRAELAMLDNEADRLEQELDAANRNFQRVSALAPLIELQRAMISSSARVVAPAMPPLEPEARNRLTISLAAALVAGLLATLFVFLRAAVREPEPPLAQKSLGGRQVDIDQETGSPRRTGEWPAPASQAGTERERGARPGGAEGLLAEDG